MARSPWRRPEDGIDPVNILAHILIALQTINSRERNQKEPLILTIGQLIAGTAENIIPNDGYLTGTIRAFNQEVRVHAKRRLEEISKGIAATFGATAEIQWYTEFAPTINDRALMAELDGYVRELLGDDRVKITEPQMGSEDFSEVDAACTGCLLQPEHRFQRGGLPLRRPQSPGASQRSSPAHRQCRLCLHCHALAGRKLLITPFPILYKSGDSPCPGQC